MTKTRRVGGNSTIIVRGTTRLFAKEIEINSNGRIDYYAPEYSYGEPEPRPVLEKSQIAFSGWWSPDFEGMRNLESDHRGSKSSLGKTVYFQLTVSNNIPLGTPITFQLWDKDTLMFLDFLVPDDYKFGGKKVYRTATVREVNGKHRITIELFLNPNWNSDLISDLGYFKDGCLDFYWTWKYNNANWTSNTNLLSVYPSETTLYIKPAINDPRYGLPEIYSNNGSIILYAIDKLPDGTVKKFSMIKLRTITTFKFQADINKFKREIYKEAINLDTNKLEAASYAVEEVATFFKTNKNASQMYIDEAITEIPIDGRGQVAVKNLGIKTVKFAKEAAKYYGQFEVIKEMKEMIPVLSSNEKFNMPSLSTFIGFIPQLEVFAFGVEVIGWMVKGSLKEAEEVVEESLWADWQNAKSKGLKDALKFVDSPWAVRNMFDSLFVGKSVLDRLLKGEFKSLTELRNCNAENFNQDKMYVIIFYEVKDETSKLGLTLVDSIFIKQEQYL
ncbi:hypothetical protein [Flavobacterium sp.]|uniref:hypothetical protein n=1 Tax=Flavobacterium sp. TaxID=239 RepID=UPI003D0C4610